MKRSLAESVLASPVHLAVLVGVMSVAVPQASAQGEAPSPAHDERAASAEGSASRPVVGEDPAELADEPSERWLLSAGFHLGPFENYPDFGLSLAIHRRLGRARLGLEFVGYPRTSQGNVARSIWTLGPHLQVLAIESRWVDWTFDLGVGVALFRDDYLQVYDDVSRAAGGFSLGTALEVRATERVRPFVAFRAVSYFAPDIVDDKWMELGAGVRLAFGRRD